MMSCGRGREPSARGGAGATARAGRPYAGRQEQRQDQDDARPGLVVRRPRRRGPCPCPCPVVIAPCLACRVGGGHCLVPGRWSGPSSGMAGPCLGRRSRGLVVDVGWSSAWASGRRRRGCRRARSAAGSAGRVAPSARGRRGVGRRLGLASGRVRRRRGRLAVGAAVGSVGRAAVRVGRGRGRSGARAGHGRRVGVAGRDRARFGVGGVDGARRAGTASRDDRRRWATAWRPARRLAGARLRPSRSVAGSASARRRPAAARTLRDRCWSPTPPTPSAIVASTRFRMPRLRTSRAR